MTDGRNEEHLAAAATASGGGAATPPEHRRLGRLGAWVLGALLLALVVVGSLPYWAPQLADLLPWGMGRHEPPPAARPQAATPQPQRVQTAPERDAAPAAPMPPAAPDTAALAARVSALERRQPDSAADTAAALAPLDQELSQLAARLDAIEARLDKLAVTAAATNGEADRMLLVAIAELRGDIASSRPYAGELAAVTALAQGRPELAGSWPVLEATAASGIPSAALLDERFTAETAPAILRADAAAPADESWAAEILARIRGLVIVRRIGAENQTGGDPTAAAVARAQAALDKGDLAGAVATLATLTGPSAQAAKSWLTTAQQRLAAEAALSDLTQRVAAHLAQSTTPPTTPPATAATPATDEQR